MPSKPLLAAIIVILAWILGYLLEPMVVRPYLIDKGGNKKPKTQEEQPVQPEPEPTPEYDLSGITQEQLPSTVILKELSNFKDSTSGLTITVDAGKPVKLVGLEGKLVVISPPGMDYTVRMPHQRTNLVEQLIALGVQPGTSAPTPTPVPVPVPVPTPTPTPDPTPIPSNPGAHASSRTDPSSDADSSANSSADADAHSHTDSRTHCCRSATRPRANHCRDAESSEEWRAQGIHL